MRRRMPAAAYAQALLFVALGTCAYGQGSLILPAFYPVQGAPFSATIDTLWNGMLDTKPGHSMSRVVRDGAGRQRFETPTLEEAAANGVGASVVIYDLVRQVTIRLDVLKKTATVVKMARIGREITIDPGVRRGFPCHAPRGGVSLGVAWIAGQEACGRRSDGADLWLSTTYLMPLKSVRDERRLGKVTRMVAQIDTVEPDAQLFEVPPGYMVTTPPAAALP